MSEMSVRVQEKGQVTIPSRIRKKLNLKPGDRVIFEETDAGVMVKAIVHSIRERFADYSTDEIESLVSEAIREAREKRA
jgi:AbrB family looped-hinge helix DNA binding protein